MSVTPSGVISEPLDKLRDLIAGTSAWQTWTGTANAAAAKLRTFPQAKSFEGLVRPFALVFWGEASLRRGGYVFGQMRVLFQSSVANEYLREAPEETDYISPLFDHANNVGAVIVEMCQDAEGDGTLHLNHDEMIRQLEAPWRCAPENLDRGETDFVQSTWECDWGLRR